MTVPLADVTRSDDPGPAPGQPVARGNVSGGEGTMTATLDADASVTASPHRPRRRPDAGVPVTRQEATR